MARRWVRALIVLVTVLVTAGAVWRATRNEQARGRVRLAAQHTDAAAADLIFELWDLRSSLHAYVAPGQSVAFWSARARTQLGSVRNRVDALAPAADEAGISLDITLNQLDALEAAERRAFAAAQDGQPLIAGDVIFTEIRDHVDKAAREVSDARQALARAASSREAGSANEQSLLAGAVSALWIFALILLVPVPAPPRAAPAAPVDAGTGRMLLRDEPAAAAVSTPPVVDVQPASGVRAPEPPQPPATEAAPSPVAVAAGVDPALLHALAGWCVEAGRVGEAAELEPLLARAADLVGARGVVVWLAAEDGRHLVAAVAHGYDAKVLGRSGGIPVDDHNLTAAAFRTRAATQAPAHDGAPAAVAVPLLSATGVSGVLAAEIADDLDLDRAAGAAAVIAAQLATLFPAAKSDEALPSDEVVASN